MKAIKAYRAARQAAHDSRALLVAQALDTRDRLAPERLWQDVVDGATDAAVSLARQGVSAARANPGKFGIGIAIIAGWLARRPLGHFAAALIDELHPADDRPGDGRDEDHSDVSEYSSDDGIAAPEAAPEPQRAANEDE